MRWLFFCVSRHSVTARVGEDVLAVGGTRDAADFLRDFLGREPNNRAFLRQKGLKE